MPRTSRKCANAIFGPSRLIARLGEAGAPLAAGDVLFLDAVSGVADPSFRGRVPRSVVQELAPHLQRMPHHPPKGRLAHTRPAQAELYDMVKTQRYELALAYALTHGRA